MRIQIEIGTSTTLYMGRFIGYDDQVKSKRGVFVSGKFGSRHHLLPSAIDLNEEAVCAAIGLSHAIICSHKVSTDALSTIHL